jgi:hypothetical protein
MKINKERLFQDLDIYKFILINKDKFIDNYLVVK